MRLEELDKFLGVCEGNASDLEHFAELLDTLIVKLCDAGQEGVRCRFIIRITSPKAK